MSVRHPDFVLTFSLDERVKDHADSTMFAVILHGFLLALGLILPLGPQNTFVFTQGARQPSLSGALPAVLTAALCDTFLIILAVGGVSLAVIELPWLRTVLLCAGIVFLAVMGGLLWRSSMTANRRSSLETNGGQEIWTSRRQIIFAASVSLGNPHAILDTVGVIGTASLGYSGSLLFLFAASCIVVSWGWFFMLSVLGRIFSRLPGTGALIERASALIMWICALYMGYLLFLGA